MGRLEDLGNAVSTAFKTGADVVATIVTGVGDAIADVAETAGNGIQEGLNALGNLLGGIPNAGGFLKGTMSWLGGIVAGITNLAGAIIKAGFGIIAGVLGGLIRIIAGILCLSWPLILKGLIDIGSGIAGAIIIMLGTLVSLGQRIIFGQNNERPLTKEEKARLKSVFHLSVSLYNIRVIEGWSGLFGTTSKDAFTLGNTIYSNQTNFTANPEILVHECVHVWQYQNLGPRYTSDALGAQVLYGRNGSGNDAYSWRAELDRGNTLWQNFNKEAAAALIQNIWKVGTMNPLPPGFTAGNGTFYEAGTGVANGSTGRFIFNAVDFCNLAIASVLKLRGAFNIRLSRFIG